MSNATIREIDPAEVWPQLGDYVVIDVREDHELEGPLGAIAGAVRIDRSALADHVGGFADRALLVVCRSGRRSAAACQALHDLGHADATNLSGGMIAWNEAGLPLERPPARSPAELADRIAHWFSMMVQTPVDAARERLGLDSAPDEGAIARALDEAVRQLDAAGPPADLALCIGVFRADLAGLAQASKSEAR